MEYNNPHIFSMSRLLPCHGCGPEVHPMQLAYSFLGICLVLLAAFLDAWCHGSLQRDRNSNGSEGGPGHCFGCFGRKAGKLGRDEEKWAGSAASGVPVAFLSLSPSLLGALWRGPGPASPKATQTRDRKSTSKSRYVSKQWDFRCATVWPRRSWRFISNMWGWSLQNFGDLKNMRWRDEQCINPWCLLAVQCGDPASRRSDRGFWGIVHRWVSWTPRSCRQWTSPFLISTSCWNHGYVRTELGKAIRLWMEMERPPASLGYSQLSNIFSTSSSVFWSFIPQSSQTRLHHFCRSPSQPFSTWGFIQPIQQFEFLVLPCHLHPGTQCHSLLPGTQPGSAARCGAGSPFWRTVRGRCRAPWVPSRCWKLGSWASFHLAFATWIGAWGVDFIDFKHESHMLSSMKFMDLTWICLISPAFAMKRHGSHIQEVEFQH